MFKTFHFKHCKTNKSSTLILNIFNQILTIKQIPTLKSLTTLTTISHKNFNSTNNITTDITNNTKNINIPNNTNNTNIINESKYKIDEFELNSKRKKAKIYDILKVVTTHLNSTNLNDSIQALQLAVTYKSYPKEFLSKIEEKFLKNLSDLDQDNLAKVIYGFYELNHSKY